MLSQLIKRVGKDLFDKVYQLAKTKNIKALDKYISEGNSINVVYKANRPITLLAKEGEFAAVEFLLRHGASINSAVNGYAQSGYVKKVENLLSRGADINVAIKGYALGGNIKEVENLLLRGASISFAAFGYAQGGNIKEVGTLLSREPDINLVVRGYAINGSEDEVNKYLRLRYYINCAIEGYAFAGNVIEVERLLKLGADISVAVNGYAQSGYVVKVDNLISRGANINNAVDGYARGGHIAQINDLLSRGAAINCAIEGYVSVGCLKEIQTLLLSEVNFAKLSESYNLAGYFRNGESALRMLFFTKDLTIRQKLMDKVSKKLPSAELARIKKILNLTEKYQLNLEQAKSLILPYTNEFFLQVIPFLNANKFPLDILIAISTFMFDVPHEEVKDIFISHNKRIDSLDKTTKVTKEKIIYWNHFLFNENNKKEKNNDTTHLINLDMR